MIAVWGWLLLYGSTCAQEPAHFLVGEEALQGTDIYSMFQDGDGLIWLATDGGLLRYDGYAFARYGNAAQKNRSLFGLTGGPDGDFYCFNLSGQIFRFSDDSLQLYHSLPDTLIASNLAIAVDSAGELYVSSNRLLRIGTDGQVTEPFPEIGNPAGAAIVHHADRSLAFMSEGDNLYILAPGAALQRHSLRENDQQWQWQAHPGEAAILLHQMGTFNIARWQNGALQRLPLQRPGGARQENAMRMHVPSDGDIWLVTASGGLYAFAPEGQPRFNGQKLFAGYQISCFLEDREGNIWLGTLGAGLLMLPRSGVTTMNRLPLLTRDKISHLSSDTDGNLYWAAQDAGLWRIDTNFQAQQIKEYPNPAQHKITFLDWLPVRQRLAFCRIFNLQFAETPSSPLSVMRFTSTIKDIDEVGSEALLLAYAQSVALVGEVPPDMRRIRDKHCVYDETPEGWVFTGIPRANCVHYDAENNVVWAGTATGLRLLTATDHQSLTWHGQPIIANAIVPIADGLLIPTSHSGILRWSEGKIAAAYGREQGLHSEQIEQLIPYRNEWLLRTPEGIECYDPAGQQTDLINAADGLSGHRIADMALTGDRLWVTDGRSLQFIDLARRRQNDVPPRLTLSTLTVNGQPTDLAGGKNFAHTENQLEFAFNAAAYRHRGRLQYFYQLEGTEEKLQRLPHNVRSVRYSSLDNGDYTFRVFAVNEDGTHSNEIRHAFTIRPPYWRTWWFFAAVLLTLTLALTLLFRYRLRAIQSRNTMLSEKQQAEKDLVASRLAAMRSQMNPHFVFNALNSIQEYIVLNEKHLASKYLGKFSDLMRIYLNHSRKSTVSLAEEIETLRLYLELEEMRFEDQLNYAVTVDENVATETEIPSLLIQPYVENAIKHGLLHKETDWQLSVHFSASAHRDLIVCTVTDNGIGRKKAREIRKARQPQHRSFATGSTANRLALLNHNNQRPIGVEFVDLHDANGAPTGTQVTLTIPAS